MRLTVSVLTLILVAGLTSSGRADQDFPREIRGVWAVAHRVFEESDTTNPLAETLAGIGERVRFQNGKMRFPDDDERDDWFKADFGNGTIDLKGRGKAAREYLAIYRIEEGVLSIVVSCGNARPTSFTEIASDQILVVMKRPVDVNDDD